MTDHELGPLPESFDYCYEWDGPYGSRKFSCAPHNGRGPDRSVPIYTADQLRSYALAEVARAVAAEREACAKVCEAIADEYTRLNLRRAPGLRFEAEVGALKCESAIRVRGQA